MKEESVAEMQTCGLGLAFLHLKRLNLGDPVYLFSKALHPPNFTNIAATVLSLKEVSTYQIF